MHKCHSHSKTLEDLLCKKEEIKWNNLIKHYKKMIKFDDVAREEMK